MQRQEVDLVEESSGGLMAYEVKWNNAKAPRNVVNKAFCAAYPEAGCRCVTPREYASLLM